jgi:hypothetical protein
VRAGGAELVEGLRREAAFDAEDAEGGKAEQDGEGGGA